MDDHQFKEEENESVGELSTVCSQIVLKCLYLARIGKPDILWSVNKLARAVTKWTKACDKRLARLISYIHHTSEYRQYCYLGNTAQQCRLTLILQEISKTKNQHQEELCALSGVTCANKLDVQDTNFSFTELHRSGNNFSWCRFTHGRYSRSHSWRLSDWNISSRTEQDWTTQGRAPGKPVAVYQAKHARPHPIQAHQCHSNEHWPHSTQHNAFWC